METFDSTSQRASLEHLLPGFAPLPALWQGDTPAFPSENSARWALKQQRQALMEAGALALLRGRLFIHQEKFVQVVRQHAFDSYKQRCAATAR